ncbi:SAM-dependent methyltransferase [Bacillus pakistanensis]|uniref:SAM-dependent methyltransferase n=1 Tax=Rossellomorea pakistanensis TaxID=992288 RepID=A0ABS2NGF1_9BACI|nr:class I SAM-dependent methyltransferase [Bacillus pakistanensis]MBM7586948.1 SAM-dependent methyltransferase [Bacillus pakistanensis]
MEHKGSSAYDEQDFFETFIKRKMRADSPNNAIEKPAIMELLPNLEGSKILDLGCGDGLFGKELLEQGASFYKGIDGSENMAELANKNLHGLSSSIVCQNLDEVKFEKNQFNLITSRLVFHYLPEIQPLFNKIHGSLVPGGHFVLSVQHPVITSYMSHHNGKEKRGHWLVDHYFRSGERIESWMEHSVVKHHRTIEEYISAALNCGFTLKGIKEGKPEQKFFTNKEEYQRRQRIPLFLILSLQK